MDGGTRISGTVDIQIGGMSCAACVSRVERALLKVPGVSSAQVNLQSERARVGGSAPMKALVAAVERAGYEARPPEAAAPVSREGYWAVAALVLAAPLILPMLWMPFGIEAELPRWSQFVIAAVVQGLFGARFFRGAWGALRAGTASMDTLVAMGTTAAFGLSLWDLAFGGPLYFEASASIIALVRTGKWLEGRARKQAGAALRALERLRPEQAQVRRDGAEVIVPVKSLRAGDLMVVRPGERFPADGLVREGEGSADESLLTGEAMPVAKRPGSAVTGGAMNGDALLLVAATGEGTEGRLARMVRLMEDAEAAKPPVQRLVDQVSAVFVPVVIGIAVAVFAGWWIAGDPVGGALVNAVAVLVIACPCALGLATPAAIATGIGVAARNGILLRDPAVLESAGSIRTVVFDKTGTLTEGHPEVLAIEGGDDVLRLAAALQSGSTHPLARATLLRAAALVVPPATNLRTLAGRGVSGVVEGRELLLGNARLLADHGIAAPAVTGQATIGFLADAHGSVLGYLAYGDRLRPGAAGAVARLRAEGLRVILLTGDSEAAAAKIAEEAGIGEWQAAALPEDKAARIAALRAEAPVAMVGDGVNDGAALAAATLGIAMAGSTDVADAAAGITLMRPDLSLVPAALDIGARIQSRIKGGLAWAFAYNLIGIPLAAAGLLNPVLAGSAMAFSSAAVVGNALLLRRWRP